MNCRCVAVGLSLVGALALAPISARCAEFGSRPLQLGLSAPALASPQMRETATARVNGIRPSVGVARQRMPRFTPAEPSLGERAFQSVLEPPEPAFDAAATGAGSRTVEFRFQRQGPAIRDLQRGYKDMCANVSSKIWDEPNGKRIKFDSAGKPGIAIVIPIR